MFLGTKLANLNMQKIRAITNNLHRARMATFSGFSLRRGALLLRYFWHTRIRRMVVPQVITVGVTYRCQCRCVHCSSAVPDLEQSRKNDEMTTLEIKDLIDQATTMGIPRITFFGGEPLMRKDICDLIKYADYKGMLTRINTNGFALNEEMIIRLKKSGLTHCDVSIDDPNPEVHDKLRGVPGLFNRVIKGIKLLKKHKMLCQIVTYAGKRSFTEGLERIIQLGRKLRVTSVSIVFPMATGCWFESFEEILNDEERRKVRALADSVFVHVEIPTPNDRCNVTKKQSLYVSPEGNVTPCPFIPWFFGNVKNERLNSLVNTFYDHLDIDCQGDCVMNNPTTRDALINVVDRTKAMLSCKTANQ